MNSDLRYARQTILPEIGPERQEKLRAASVLIVGAGGLGSPVALYLTAAGVGRIGLADPDTVSESNLQRQILYDESQIGRPKVFAARQRLSALSSHTRFDCYPQGISKQNAERIIRDYDLAVDCCDSFAVRYLLDDACAACGKPWIHGSIGQFHGQLAVLNYRSGRRYADLYPGQREALCAQAPASSGVLGAVPGIIGALQAAEAVKLLVGFGRLLDGQLMTLDAKTMETAVFTF